MLILRNGFPRLTAQKYNHTQREIQMNNRFFMALLAIFATAVANAQFCTITRQTPIEAPSPFQKSQQANIKTDEEMSDTIESSEFDIPSDVESPFAYTRKRKVRRPRSIMPTVQNARPNRGNATSSCRRKLPKLTIPNLIIEIERNGIQHPDIVLAQAILETAWFTSPVCRNKNNLFGLTNPRTGKYYEFNHWTESVEAYYTKVQYRYKGGNYLRWLNKIGYAEAPDYVRALIRVLRQLRG